MNYINIAQRVINHEIRALSILAEQLPADFTEIIEYILSLKGRIILTGIGKSGHIARKIAASFASSGAPSFYVHPAEASHGDLGMITTQDLVIALSNSGQTQELTDVINYCKKSAIKIACITADATSFLAKNSDFLLLIPNIDEASSISAPTTSSLMMLALGDALTVCIQELKGFNKDDFASVHPGGKLGMDLIKNK